MNHYLSVLESSMKSYWDSPAVCNYRGESFTHANLAENITKFGLMFEKAGLKKGDKVAICAKNTARWAMAFLAANVYEAVVVSILADFHPDSVNKLVDHSGSVLLFTDKEIWENLDPAKMPTLRTAVCADDFSMLYCTDDKFKAAFESMDSDYKALYPNGISKDDVHLPIDNFDKLAVINYTSGTTSAPKGVMLSYGNLSASIYFGHVHIPIRKGDTLVSMLPMAHIYGMVYEFLYPVTGGCTVYFLGKSPAPSLLLKAMADVRPYLVCTVPLVMEKIYKSKLKPTLDKWFMKVLFAIPGIKGILANTVREKLDSAFGGQVREYVMGGAALNPEVENCFRKIGLHYTVGYGMTEAAPLLAYESWNKYAKGSCGKPADCDVRIDSDDPAHIAGEIQAKGLNITNGYFNNPEATAAAFTEDGYLKTGDIGVMDAQGNIFIKGRSKNMILSANGQNIYPEEIEAVVNNQLYVVESVVVDRGGKLVALVYLDQDAIKNAGLTEEDIADIPSNVVDGANKSLPNYSKLVKAEVMLVPFEKTPKMSIKRFMYK